MEFEFTEGQGLLRDCVRRLLAREYTFPLRQRILASRHGFSGRIWRLLAHEGLLSLGGRENGSPVEIMLVMEELGRALLLEPFASTVVLGAGLIYERGTVAQRAKLLPKIASGECRIALAHQEAGSRYVLDRVGTVALRGRGSYLLNGAKTAVTDAPLADMLIVSARDEAVGGLSLFMLAPNAPGLTMSRYRTPDGRSAADITLQGVKVPSAARLGSPGFALTGLERAADRAIAATCAEAVGVMEGIIELGRPVLGNGMLELLVTTMSARSVSYLAAQRCRGSDRCLRRRTLTAARAFLAQAIEFVGQQTAQIQDAGTPAAALAIRHYSRRLTAINATLGDVGPEPRAFRKLLGTVS
jgi:alkylation response protein AidB-like acyl-CoA dehydrogenase